MDLGLTWFDFVAIVVLGLSGVMAFARGLIREVFSIIAFIGGAIAAVFFAGMLSPLVESMTPLSGPLASVAAGLLIFLVVSLFVLLMRQSGPEEPTAPADPMQDAIRGARTYPIYEGVAKGLEAVLPTARERTRDMINGQKGESAPIPPAEPAAEAPSH
jgi:membrane protein required for colicin V production